MKAIRSEQSGFWTFVLPVTALIAIILARHSGIAAALVSAAVALLLAYFVDKCVH